MMLQNNTKEWKAKFRALACSDMPERVAGRFCGACSDIESLTFELNMSGNQTHGCRPLRRRFAEDIRTAVGISESGCTTGDTF